MFMLLWQHRDRKVDRENFPCFFGFCETFFRPLPSNHWKEAKEHKMTDIIEKTLTENYEKYYRFAFSIVRIREDALDVVQEAAYKAIKNQKSLRNKAYADTWIHKIILNTAMDFLEKKKKEVLPEDWDALEMKCTAFEENYGKVELECVLDALSPQERGMIVMKYFEEMKLEAIAAATGKNVNTVKSQLYRALDKLQNIF